MAYERYETGSAQKTIWGSSVVRPVVRFHMSKALQLFLRQHQSPFPPCNAREKEKAMKLVPRDDFKGLYDLTQSFYLRP